MEKFLEYIEEEYCASIITDYNDIENADVIYQEISTADGYNIYARLDNKFQLDGSFEDALIYEEYGIYSLIAESIKDGCKVYIEDEEWLEGIKDEFEDEFEDEED
tara:strand:+ start:186 stop:500 length:315 start_codon:yes stop_codon:yes gene_type:complete